MNDTQNDNIAVWKKIYQSSSALALRIGTVMPEFCRTQERNRKNVAIVSLNKRVYSNLVSIGALASVSVKNEGNVRLKHPVGLLVRGCLIDCIVGVYIKQMSLAEAEQLLDIGNRDYVKALFDEFEVYKDKTADICGDDEFLEHVYTLCLEDTYINELDINDECKQIEPLNERHIWKSRKPTDIKPDYKSADSQIKTMVEHLCASESHKTCVKRLFAYYKYFSQYEHFSERGFGDAFQNFGSDNIRFEKVFDCLEDGLRMMVSSQDH